MLAITVCFNLILEILLFDRTAAPSDATPESRFNLILEILLFDRNHEPSIQCYCLCTVSISFLRFFSLIGRGRDYKVETGDGFNLILEILLFDRFVVVPSCGAYGGFNLILEILLFDRAWRSV